MEGNGKYIYIGKEVNKSRNLIIKDENFHNMYYILKRNTLVEKSRGI